MNMTSASFAQKKAMGQHDQSRAKQDETVSQNLGMYSEVHDALEKKVHTSHRLVDTLQRRASSVENSIYETKNSLSHLEHALASKNAPLQQCTWRTRHRDMRPQREQVRDNVEASLKDEKQSLIDSQRELSSAIRKTEAVISLLKSCLDNVRADHDRKTQACGVDEMCLRTTHKSWQLSAERAQRPHSSGGSRSGRSNSARGNYGSHRPIGFHESSQNETYRQNDTAGLDSYAERCERDAQRRCDENARLIVHCDQVNEEMLSRSERCLQGRANENQSMRKRLTDEIDETRRKIERTQHTIAATRSEIKALEEPMDLISTCNSWRKRRAGREQIMDPVSAKISAHHATVQQSLEELKATHNNEKIILQELTDRKARLKDDLKDKTASLNIDLNCLSNESSSAREKPTLSLDVNPSFVPMATMGISQLRSRSSGAGGHYSPGNYSPSHYSPSRPSSSRCGAASPRRRPQSAMVF